jgi:hypothetical protein|tara:strand:- start:1331 stop:1516 length:186 start_codon:yes stop_codon:yes gene_type:complete
MNSIKGVLFLKNVDGEMKWVNGDLGNKGKYEGEFKNGKKWNGSVYDNDGIKRSKYVNGVKP